MNINWPRWIRTTCILHFKNIIEPGLLLHIEGTDRRTVGEQSYTEFRLDGPFANEINPDYWLLDIEINVLIVTIRNDEDIYQHDRNVGLAATAFTKGIPVFKYGDGEDDDPFAQLGCLILQSGKREKIVISHFGQVADDTRMIQSTVEAHYRLHLQV